ncbi:unnamed protein product [Absidia cylindrospora]
MQLYRDHPSAFCKNVIDGYTYANTQVLYELASCFKANLLMNLCQLTEHTPMIERYSLLQRIPLLDITSIVTSSTPSPSLPRFSNDLHVQLVEHVLHPVRLDGQEWFLQPWIQQYQQHQRLSPPQEKQHHSPPFALPDVSVTDMDSRTKEASLLLQRRLAPKLGHHAPHLTINTPTYKDHHLHSIQSAPLRKSISQQQINKRLQAAASAAAAAAAASGANSRHLAHPSSSAAITPWLHRHHDVPRMAPQRNPGISGSMNRSRRPSSLSSSLSSSPPPSSTAGTEKQSFLHPFEQLHGTLEHARTQKSTLDDTIRQASVTLGKLQQPSFLENIDSQVTKQMAEWMPSYLVQMEQCMGRILALEAKVVDKRQQTTAIPATVPAMTTKMELLALMNRLDQLEQKTTPAFTGQ